MKHINLPTAFVKLLVSLLSILIIMLIFSYNFWQYFTRDTHQSVGSNTTTVKIRQIVNLTDTLLKKENNQHNLLLFNQFINISNANGLKMFTSDKPYYIPLTHTAKTSITKILKQDSNQINFSYQMAKQLWLNVDYNLIPYELYLKIILLIIEISLMLIVMIYIWFFYRSNRAWRQLQFSAEHLANYFTFEPISVTGNKTIKAAITSINTLLKKISDLNNERLTTIIALSHDLLTPLTRAKLYIENLQISDEKKEKQLLAALDEMELRFKEVLFYQKKHYYTEKKVIFSLTTLVDTLCFEHPQATKIDFINKAADWRIVGQIKAIKQAIENILANALRYGSEAIVTIEKQANVYYLSIEDKGRGLSDDAMRKVFEPFYRSEKSRSRATGGTGLGLTIAKEIITFNTGQIQLQNSKAGGLKVILSFSAL